MTTTLLRGGAVYTPVDPFATAMLVNADTVAWVGSEPAAAWQARDADVTVELRGALVTPVFVDAHVHLTETGLADTGVDLGGARSVGEVLDAVARAARRRPGHPVSGFGWDEGRIEGGLLPTAAELERAGGGALVYLARVDVHSALVSASLAQAAGLAELAGWDRSGRVERAAHHAARTAVRAGLTPGRRRELQLAALRAAARRGIGCVHEMSAPDVGGLDDLAGLHTLDAGDAVPDVVGYWGEFAGDEESARAIRARVPGPLAGLAGDLCVDGAFGSRTAALHADYADALGQRGRLYLDASQIAAHVVACTRVGLQAGFHAIGDAAVDEVVAGFRAAAAQLGTAAVASAGHRVEHLEAVGAGGVRSLAELGVTASMQPCFDALWGGGHGMYAARLGQARAADLNPFAALAGAGVNLAFGSDSPVTPFDPWRGVQAAAFHHEPVHRISVRAAFAAHTRGGWRAAGEPGAGVLAPGAGASFAVWDVPGELVVQTPDRRVAAWSTDPRSGTPGLPDLAPGQPLPTCRATVVRGRALYRADDHGTGVGR